MPQRDEPLQQYYPGCRVRLIIRLEDFGKDDTPEPPERPTTIRRGKGDKASSPSLEVQRQDDGSFLLLAPGDDPSALGSPQQQRESSDKRTFGIEGIIPRTCQVMLNGIRTADTCSMDIYYRDLPLDPRVIRSIAVEAFIGTVPAADFQRGIQGEVRSDATPSGQPFPWNTIPEEYTDSNGKRRTNLRFQGWVDDWELMWGESDVPVVHLECTDNTRLLLEQNAGPKLTVDPDIPIDEAFARYLSNYPQFRGLSVSYLPAGSDPPVFADALNKTAYQPKLGPAASKGGSSQLKVWDYLTDVAGALGLSIRFEGTTVILQRPRTLLGAAFSGRPDDPFTGRNLPSGTTLLNRLYVYGHNLAELSFRRKFARFDPQNIEVRSYDTGEKKTLVVRFPEKDKRQKSLQPGDSSDQKWTVLRVTGIRDEETLRVVAQQLYEQIGRQELESRFVTKNLASFGGGNLDPDALDVRPGDPIDVEVGTGIDSEEGGETTQEDIAAKMRTQASDFLQALGFPQDFADAYQEAVSNIGVQSTFRVRSFGIDWDYEAEGVTLDFECTNYIEVRADAELPQGEEIEPTDSAGAQPVDVVVEDVGGGV